MLCYRCKPVTVCQVISFLGKATLCAMDIHNFASCCVLFRVKHWMLHHSPAHLFLFIFPFQYNISFRDYLISRRLQPLCDFLMLLLLQMLHPVIRSFICMVLGFPYSIVEPGQVVCTRFITPSRNSRLLHQYCVKFPFYQLPGKVVALHLYNSAT